MALPSAICRWRTHSLGGIFGPKVEMTPIRVAICDDHPVFRSGLAAVLAAEPDIDVCLEAGTVAELRERLQSASVDLLLLDVELPGESGIEALPTLLDGRRVLMLSAHDDPRRVKAAVEAGACGFVRKDAAPRELLKAVRDAAAGKTVMSADLAIRLADALRSDPDSREFRRIVGTFTPRQREVMALVGEGQSNREIAERLFLSEGTVKNHVTHILQALQLPDRTRLAVLVTRYGAGR